MADPDVGDKVKVITKERAEQGILMPSDEGTIIIKLDNGYNIGFEKKDVQVELIKKQETKEVKFEKIKHKDNLSTIVILHTGGTIASKVDYSTGAVTAKFTADDLLLMFPELADIANIETELVANMMSEDMVFADYSQMAKAVEKWSKKCAGIIIGHGTDTLSYTSAALAFMLEKINIPVLVVGSQRSTDRGSSDAGMNLVCAARFITQTDFAGVAVCMHHTADDETCAILSPTKVRKMHTSRRDAFKPINAEPIAIVGKGIKFLQDYHKTSKDKLILKDKMEGKVGLIKMHPGVDEKLVEYFTKNYKGIVIEGTGLGHAPTNLGENNLKTYGHIKKFIEGGGVVAVTSQCLFGRVHPNVYTNLRRLSEIGCIYCEDMLPETAFIKLSWLLGNHPKEAKKLMDTNLRGEINERLMFDEDFLQQ